MREKQFSMDARTSDVSGEFWLHIVRVHPRCRSCSVVDTTASAFGEVTESFEDLVVH